MTAAPDRAPEAARQQAIIEALFAPERAAACAAAVCAGVRGTPEAREAGLGAYRGNGIRIAERSLQVAYPVTFGLLGESAASAAVHLWRIDPPRSGDLADWGAGFADWLDSQPSLAEWPQLAGCARIEWARHRAERCGDTATDIDSLARLGTHAADVLCLRLKPDVVVVRGAPGFYETWRDAFLVGAGPDAPEAVVVWRDGFAPRTEPLTPGGAIWLETLSAGARLSDRLAALPETDLETTMAKLISRGWLLDIVTTEGPA